MFGGKPKNEGACQCKSHLVDSCLWQRATKNIQLTSIDPKEAKTRWNKAKRQTDLERKCAWLFDIIFPKKFASETKLGTPNPVFLNHVNYFL